MQFSETDNKLQQLIQELERIYSQFKKIDVFKAVSNAYKKVHPFMHVLSNKELEEIKLIAINDLQTA